jgi:hypothetical protein
MSLPILAQNVPERRFEAAAVLGPTITQLDGDRLRGFRRWGVEAGLQVSYVFDERWRAGIELLYTQHGSQRRDIDDRLSADTDIEKININMVQAPLLVHFRDWKVGLTAGASYGNIINYEVIEVDGEDAALVHPLSEDVFSLILGGTFHFTEKIALEVRWSRWLNSPYDEAAVDANEATILPWIGRAVTVRGAYKF